MRRSCQSSANAWNRRNATRGLASIAVPFRTQPPAIDGCRLRGREEDRELRAFADFALHMDRAMYRLDEALHDRKSQAGALVGQLGGKLLGEEALEILRRNARTSVADDERQSIEGRSRSRSD